MAIAYSLGGKSYTGDVGANLNFGDGLYNNEAGYISPDTANGFQSFGNLNNLLSQYSGYYLNQGDGGTQASQYLTSTLTPNAGGYYHTPDGQSVLAYDSSKYSGPDAAAYAWLDNLPAFNANGLSGVVRNLGLDPNSVISGINNFSEQQIAAGNNQPLFWLGSPAAILKSAAEGNSSLSPQVQSYLSNPEVQQQFNAGQKMTANEWDLGHPATSLNSNDALDVAAGIGTVLSGGLAGGASGAGAGAAGWTSGEALTDASPTLFGSASEASGLAVNPDVLQFGTTPEATNFETGAAASGDSALPVNPDVLKYATTPEATNFSTVPTVGAGGGSGSGGGNGGSTDTVPGTLGTAEGLTDAANGFQGTLGGFQASSVGDVGGLPGPAALEASGAGGNSASFLDPTDTGGNPELGGAPADVPNNLGTAQGLTDPANGFRGQVGNFPTGTGGDTGGLPAGADKGFLGNIKDAYSAVNKYGPLVSGAYQAISGRNAGKKYADQLKQIGGPQAAAAQQMLQQAQAGQLPAGSQAAIDQWKNQAIAQSRAYFAKAGLSNSSQAQQAEAQIAQQAENMKAQQIQTMLQTAMSELNITDQNQVKAVQAEMQSDQAVAQQLNGFLSSYGNWLRALPNMTS